jgi:hypothetical protein
VKRANPFRGRWRIVSTDVWEKKDLDDLGPAQITFGRDRTGELNLIAIEGSVDYRVGTRDGAPIAEFSWEGEMTTSIRHRAVDGHAWTAEASSAACSFIRATRPSSSRSAFRRSSAFVHTQTGVYHTQHGN